MLEAPDPTGDPLADAETAIGRSLVDAVIDARRGIAALQALEMRLLAAAQAIADEQRARIPAASREREMPLRSIAAEIGAATRSSDRTVQRRLSEATAIAARLPAAIAALDEGPIDRAHLLVIHEVGMPLPAGDALAEFERLAVAIAERETPGRLRALIRILADRLHPDSLTTRHERARQKRSVSVTELDDGMAEVRAVLPTALASGIDDRLDRIARTVIDARGQDTEPSGEGTEPEHTPDTRTMTEVRADAFADLLLTGAPETMPAPADGNSALDSIRAHIHVTIPVRTLTGAGDESGELFGHGPVDADTLRRLAGATSAWTRIFTHPVTGNVLAVDRYRPTPAHTRLLRVRDEHCRFPGCRRPAWRCDIDHTVAAADGGPTRIGNLAHLCRRHHSLKRHTRWTVRQHPDGTLRWTSPQGRTHDDHPARTVAFHATGDPPPF